VGRPVEFLHVDGIAPDGSRGQVGREASIPVIADLDNLYPGVEALLEHVDYLILRASSRAPERAIKSDVLEDTQALWKPVAAATLGGWRAGLDGRSSTTALRLKSCRRHDWGGRYSRRYAYALFRLDLTRALEFSCAAAGLACTAPGARAESPQCIA